MHRSNKGTTLSALLFLFLVFTSSSALAATDQTETLLLDAAPQQQVLPTPWGIDLDAYAVDEQGAAPDILTDSIELPAQAVTPASEPFRPAPNWGINLAQYDIPNMTFAPEEVVTAEAEEQQPEPTPAPAHNNVPPPIAPAERPTTPPVEVAGGGNAATPPGQEVAYAPPPNVIESPTHVPDTSSLEQEIVLDERGLKALEQFHTFAQNRLTRIANNLRASIDNMEIENAGGVYIARYMRINASTLSLQVKPADYEHTPFVGVMRYQREIYEATGATAEAAMAGQFEMVRDTKITEIFRYTRDKWEE